MEAFDSTSLIPQNDKNKREILKAKLVYLFYYGASASLMAYLPVYLRQVNMDGVQTGILTSIKYLITFVSAPLWGGIADRTARHKAIVLVAVVFYTLLITALYPFSLIKNNQAVHGNTNSNISRVNKTKTVENITQTGVLFIQGMLNAHPTNPSKASGLNNELEFWLMFIFLAIAFFFMATVTPILDANVVTLTNNTDYGKQRLWGAIGFGFFGLLSGVLASGGKFGVGVGEKANFLLPFILFIVLNVLVLIVSFTMEIKRVDHRKEAITVILPHIKVLLTDALVIFFLILIFIIGVSSGVSAWYFVFLKDIGGSQAVMGIAIVVSCFSEVIVFQFADKMINLLGNSNVLLLSLAAFVMRLIGYSYLHNPWIVLPIELLHGFTYSAMWSSCVSYGTKISPPEVVTTVIGIITGIYFGLGRGVGGVLGGVAYTYYGARVLFRGCAVMCGVGIVLQLFTEMVLKRLWHGTHREL